MLPPILLQSRHWLMIDKPAGLAVHPGPRTPHSLEALLSGYAVHGRAPVAVHRLDRDTSGCLLLARTPSATRKLGALFSGREVEKLYWAVVENAPAEDQGQIDAPLLKTSSAAQGWRMIVDPKGKPAQTGWEVIERRGSRALVAFQPLTGRTHQIRVHATLLAPGASIMGDPVYGMSDAAGMLLHARRLSFPDPWTQMPTAAEAPCPARFASAGFDMKG